MKPSLANPAYGFPADRRGYRCVNIRTYQVRSEHASPMESVRYAKRYGTDYVVTDDSGAIMYAVKVG